MDCRLPGLPSPCYCPGKNIGVSCHSLLQGIFPTQGLNLHLLHYRQILYRDTGKHFKLWNSTLIAWKDRVGSYRGEDTAAAAKSLQSCPTLCIPIDGSPPGSPHPWDSPGKNTGVGCHFLLQCMKWKVKGKLLSCVRLLASTWTAAYQAPPSVGFSRQESGVPLPSPWYSARHKLSTIVVLMIN